MTIVWPIGRLCPRLPGGARWYIGAATRMTKTSLFRRLLCSALLVPWPARAASERFAGVVLFHDAGFPAADTVRPPIERLHALLPGAVLATEAGLPALLARRAMRLLILPFGSAFPEAAWSAIHAFLARGGNLLVVGGRPFTRAAHRDGREWRLRPYSTRFIRELLIDQYQDTPGSHGLEFEANPDAPPSIERFEWTRAFSPVIRLAARDLYQRDGAAGSLDARLDALAWGTKGGRRLAAPVLQIDHLRDRFAGGRWIFVNAELAEAFHDGAGKVLIPALAARALQGREELVVRPRLPLYVAGEKVELEIRWRGRPAATAEITVSSSEPRPTVWFRRTVELPGTKSVSFAAPRSKGLQVVETRLLVAGDLRAVYRSGFWMRDRDYLRSGPRLSVNRDYFELDGQPLAVVGTTHMASDVQRLFFEYPNVAVWDRDLAEIAGAGLTMLRTGWWSAWDKLCDGRGRAHDRTVRTLEAYLMTARRHRLPVQFTFFAFLPDVLGGSNAYFDPLALRKQRALIQSVVEPFHDVPFLALDLINEPSFSRQLWTDRPNRDPIELRRWNDWLARRYPDREALAQAWNVPATVGRLSLPADNVFAPRAVYAGGSSLALHDYFLFAQESFAAWVRDTAEVVRATGSRQLVTVGQDEGGFLGRPSPAFFGPAIDFTTNHTWWENDALLWDSLVARQPGRAMLIQETGVQRELTLDAVARRTPDGEAALVERKMAMAFVQGAGAIQWLWHTNAYMTQGNEAPIGALRADGTDKPEAGVVRAFARFGKELGPHLRAPQQPAIAIVTSQAAELSVMRDMQVEAQRRAVRALVYDSHQPAYVIAENQIEKLGTPRLAILPSPQALGEPAWRALMAYVVAGGNLIVTGPVERDEHWQRVQRIDPLIAGAVTEPITFRSTDLRLAGAVTPVSFAQPKQAALDRVRLPDGASLREVPHGKGTIFWAALPLELAEGGDPAARLYQHVLERIGLSPPFQARAALPSGVLVYPTILEDAVLYVMVSERADDTDLDLTDRLTGARLTLRLRAQRATLVLLRKSDGTRLASFGP
jgi:hypothetical protein